MPSPTSIDKIASLLARFEAGSLATLAPSALRLLAAAIVAHGRFPLGHELTAWLTASPDRFAPIREAFDRLLKPDQDVLCARLGQPSPALFRQAIAFPAADEPVPARPDDAEAVRRLYRSKDPLMSVDDAARSSRWRRAPPSPASRRSSVRQGTRL